MKLALGHLGWTEREYYTSSPEAVYYALEGYFDKRQQEESWFRMVGYPVFALAGGKGDINKYWPMHKGNKSEPKKSAGPMTPERKAAIIDRYSKKLHGSK